jgi:hypothetical protein
MTQKNCWLAGLMLMLGAHTAEADSPQQTWCGGLESSADQPARETPTREELRITRQLMQPIRVEFYNKPLRDVLADLSRLSRLSIVADEDACARSDLNLSIPLSMVLDNTPARSVLQIVGKKLDLAYEIKDGAVWMFPRSSSRRTSLTSITYPVADLIVPIENGPLPVVCRLRAELRWAKSAPAAPGKKSYEEELIVLLSHVEPAWWREMGGRGTIQFYPLGMALVIQQTPEMHERIATLLTELRHLQDIEYQDHTLVLKIVEIQPNGNRKEHCWPKLTFVRNQLVRLAIGTTVPLKEGTVRDLVRDENGIGIVQAGFVQEKQAAPDRLRMGESMHCKLTGPSDGPLCLDLTIEQSDVEEASKDGIVLAGKTYRVLRKVQLGTMFKMVLERDAHGDSRRWLECTVSRQPLQTDAVEFGPLPR